MGVVKTEVCHYSDLKIYPGHGTKIITREGKIHIYLHKKAKSQAVRKIKPQNIKWTTSWRRANKKIKNTDIAKKKRRKAKRVVREIVGMTADEINRRKAEGPSERKARNDAVQQIRQRKANAIKVNKKPTAPKQVAKPQKGG